jgi:dTDP-glucose pyrophosphorylase
VKPALVVLAAGMSTRYGRPKQLEPVGPSGETLLDYGIFDACRAGFGPVILIIRRELESAMRAHLAERWPGLDAAWAFQEIESGRAKPWGTAQAILAARAYLDRPAGVCNADDFYGAEGFRALGQHLTGRDPAPAIVAYRLADTLSAHGGVSRAVCDADPAGWLTGLTELREVREAGPGARGVDPAGRTRDVAADVPVSMNLWGVTPELVAWLDQGFAAFAASHAADPAAEYPLSTAVHDLVIAGRTRVAVLASGTGWMGITHPDDRLPVSARLRALVRSGTYPSPLTPPDGGAE